MKRGEFNLEVFAVDCSGLPDLGDAGKEIFRALKVACNGEGEGSCDGFASIRAFNFLVLNVKNEYRLRRFNYKKETIQPSDVLGQAAIDAAMDGATIVFEGDVVPAGDMAIYWKDGSSGDAYQAFKIDSYLNPNIIAYKLLEEAKDKEMNKPVETPKTFRELYPQGVYTRNSKAAFNKLKELLKGDERENDENKFHDCYDCVGLDSEVNLKLVQYHGSEPYREAAYITNEELFAIDLNPSKEETLSIESKIDDACVSSGYDPVHNIGSRSLDELKPIESGVDWDEREAEAYNDEVIAKVVEPSLSIGSLIVELNGKMDSKVSISLDDNRIKLYRCGLDIDVTDYSSEEIDRCYKALEMLSRFV